MRTIPAIEVVARRSDLRRPHAAQEPGVRGGGGGDAGARYWGEYGHFQRLQCGAFQAAALCGAGPHRDALGTTARRKAEHRGAGEFCRLAQREPVVQRHGGGDQLRSSFILGGQGEAARLAGAGVSSNFFSLLGVRFTLGRNFLPEEDRPGQNRVAILSYRIWQERFGADRDIAGKHITLNDNSYTVVGVLPADFQFASNAADFQARSQADIWVPIALDPQKLQRGTHPLRVIARLKPGVELAQAQAELDVIGGEPGATVSGGQPGQRDHGGSAGGAGDGECSRGTRDASWRGWTGAADRLRERRQPSAQPGGGAPERDGGSGCAGRKPRAAGAATSDGEPVSGEHRRDRGLPFRAGCDRGLVSAFACRPVARPRGLR